MKDNKYKLIKSRIKKMVILCCIGMILCMLNLGIPDSYNIIAHAEDAAITALSAAYSGPAVMIGEEIDTQYLVVTATYSDGVTDVIKDYTIVSKVVAATGINKGTVIYQGKTANYYVQGKKMTGIHASYIGPSVSIGNKVAKKNIYALAEFNDGSLDVITDYNVIASQITSLGKNKIPIAYEDYITYIEVTGVAPKTIISLYAAYSGGEVTVGSSVNPSDLIITAVYADGTSEEINNYDLTPSTVMSLGVQNIVAQYHGATVSFSVSGAERTVSSIKAKYTGNPIGVGYAVRTSDITVTATYNDGTSEVVTDFTVLNPTASYVGYHVMTVEYEQCTASFIIQVVDAAAVDYSNACTFTVTNNTNTATVSIALPKNIDNTSISGNSLRASSVSSVLSRAVRKSQFIAFTIELNEDEMIEEFPLTMKIKIPSEFDIDYTSLYYTSNKKSIIGRMNTDDDGSRTMTCLIYHPGTYIISYKK